MECSAKGERDLRSLMWNGGGLQQGAIFYIALQVGPGTRELARPRSPGVLTTVEQWWASLNGKKHHKEVSIMMTGKDIPTL